MKNNKYISKSRRVTPWDSFEELTPLQDFIRSHYVEHYVRTHKSLIASKEYELLNSFTPTKCPYCNSTKFVKNGYTKNKIQRYKCCDCFKTFTVLNGTIFQNHKISISEWIEFCLNLFHYDSISSDSKSNKNAMTTSNYWMHKLFLLLEDYQKDIVLSGTIYLDETYYSVVQSDLTYTKDGNKKRGISQNKICIATAYDKTHVICFVCGKGKPSVSRMIKAFDGHLEEGSTVIHDGENSHSELIRKFKLKEKVYPTKQTKNMTDKDNPLYPINQIHFLLKAFLNTHSGFNRKDLQSYLDFFCLKVNPPYDELAKIELLLEFSLSEEKNLTYRSFYAHK
jgi:transposase-like protein